MKCPKCRYIRSGNDGSPDWQCPSCGIAYTKYEALLNQDENDEFDNDLNKNRKVMEWEFMKYSTITFLAMVPLAIYKTKYLYSLFFLVLCVTLLLLARVMLRTGCSFGPMMVRQNKNDNPIMYKIEVVSAFLGALWCLYLAIESLLS